MKKTTAETHLNVYCNCPHCNGYQNVTDEAKDHLEDDLRATNIELEITCEDCGETFLVTEITY